MSRLLLLDNNVLTHIVRPEIEESHPLISAVLPLMDDPRFTPCVPEIIDYEVRRKLLHIGHHRHHGRKWARDALVNLDRMASVYYLPLTTRAMQLAAELWAESRARGQSRATEDGLDIDVILAAQARQVGGCVVTFNEKHFRDLVEIFDWRPYLAMN